VLPAPARARHWPPDQVVLLAHLLGAGHVAAGQPVRYRGADEASLRAVEDAAASFGVAASRARQDGCWQLCLPAPQPVLAWLAELGLPALPSREAFVPAAVFGLPRPLVALFLRHLWAAGGTVSCDVGARRARISLASPSRRLVDDVARLLLRFGIHARITAARGRGSAFRLRVDGVDAQRVFLTEIGVHGAGAATAAAALRLIGTAAAATPLATVPDEVWDQVRRAMTERRGTHRAPATIGGPDAGATRPAAAGTTSRGPLARAAEILEAADLCLVGTGDVGWDEVDRIVPLGPQPVFDATVAGTHNFIADGVVAHNSLEQDADAVILLYREDAVEKESARAGEADLIVAKHRNGPTGTVTVAFQGHYSRFVDMAN
ncbi:MAG: intein-containing replicative DNA helicase, partial [Frankia sp.]|nr:intein-containing replicative DNA helicase [Frankia sp.]